VAALSDGLRHQIYAFIRAARRPVTRDQAAAAAGISRKLAAFHLDKLVAAGLLHASTGPPGGPARAGRPPKLYQPAGRDLHVSIPVRQHDELAGILVDAVLTEAPGENARQAALRAARARGMTLGAAARTRPGHLGAERALTLAQATLHHWGYEPDRTTPTCLRLRNCPFHPLAAKAPDLVCGINHAFLAGFLTGLHATTVEAVLDPQADECCVELRPAAASTTAHEHHQGSA
jgi:predicted ArsR family transcriptional regulator